MFWESNPTNIKRPVFRGNTAITLNTQKTMGDPILPMFSLCLNAVEVWDSSFQGTSVFLVGIEESSGIEWEIL